MNDIINRARALAGLYPYVLESFDVEDGIALASAWHHGEWNACFRRLGTVEFVELLGELIEDGWIKLEDANALLMEGNASFSYAHKGSTVAVRIIPLTDLEARADSVSHPNIRVLLGRMNSAAEKRDWSGVLHASSNIFETLAKEVVGTPGVRDKTLGAFIDGYRKSSTLPPPVLDYIHEIYKRRNKEPLAGHGQLDTPTVTEAEAKMLVVMTKAFITFEKEMLTSGAATSASRSSGTSQ
ncbi:hypothetical protein [Micromonospora sp. bgisy143]|uniref:hypothetical protein n=1 Tax=Micromonospora sp. bgisy143 TaxID=3413790 RepID=UPI003EB9801C